MEIAKPKPKKQGGVQSLETEKVKKMNEVNTQMKPSEINKSENANKQDESTQGNIPSEVQQVETNEIHKVIPTDKHKLEIEITETNSEMGQKQQFPGDLKSENQKLVQGSQPDSLVKDQEFSQRLDHPVLSSTTSLKNVEEIDLTKAQQIVLHQQTSISKTESTATNYRYHNLIMEQHQSSANPQFLEALYPTVTLEKQELNQNIDSVSKTRFQESDISPAILLDEETLSGLNAEPVIITNYLHIDRDLTTDPLFQLIEQYRKDLLNLPSIGSSLQKYRDEANKNISKIWEIFKSQRQVLARCRDGVSLTTTFEITVKSFFFFLENHFSNIHALI